MIFRFISSLISQGVMKASVWFHWLTCVSLVLIRIPSSSQTDTRTKKAARGSKIVGGHWARQQDFPFIVSIQIYYAEWSHHCGGSIITPKVVVTACHCIVSKPKPLAYRRPSTLRVVAGTGTLYNPQDPNVQVARVERLEAHGACSKALWTDDAGVIVLKNGFRFNNFVRPIKVYSTNITLASNRLWYMQQANKKCYVAGWGSYDGENYGEWLKFAPVRLITHARCEDLNCKFRDACNIDYWQKKQVCAIDEKSIFCYGDSGGPLMCDGLLFGIVSYHYGCNTNFPMTFTDIDPLLNTLRKYLGSEYRR